MVWREYSSNLPIKFIFNMCNILITYTKSILINRIIQTKTKKMFKKKQQKSCDPHIRKVQMKTIQKGRLLIFNCFCL